MPGIVIKTLTKRYGEVAAVEGLSLDVKPGELVSLLAKRVALSKEIGATKRVAGLPTLDPAREAEVIRRAAALARDASLNDEKVRDIFWHVIGLSRGAQTEGE